MTSLTFAVLGIPFYMCAAKLEWDGPSYGSRPTVRKGLWLAWLACTATAVYCAVVA